MTDGLVVKDFVQATFTSWVRFCALKQISAASYYCFRGRSLVVDVDVSLHSLSNQVQNAIPRVADN